MVPLSTPKKYNDLNLIYPRVPYFIKIRVQDPFFFVFSLISTSLWKMLFHNILIPLVRRKFQANSFFSGTSTFGERHPSEYFLNHYNLNLSMSSVNRFILHVPFSGSPLISYSSYLSQNKLPRMALGPFIG